MLKVNEWLMSVGIRTDIQDIVARISMDSRDLDASTWWLATQGLHHHALDFYSSAQPCAGILYEPPYADVPNKAIAIPDLHNKISALADCFYQYPSKKLTVIGVTGTDGKSSLVHFLAQALNASMIGTIGYGRLGELVESSHTTPDAIKVQKMLAEFYRAGCHTVAMEVSSHALMQGRINAVDFSIAVFTNLSRDHLDYHATLEEYFLTKAKLFAMPIRHAIINLDDAYGRRLINEKRIHKNAQIWGVSSQLQENYSYVDNLLYATDICLDSNGIALTLIFGKKHCRIQSSVLARFNVDNLLNVSACLLANGIEFEALPELLATLSGVPGRVERIDLGEQRAAIIDYAHTLGAIESVLKGIRAHVPGKLWIVFGCGGDRDPGKRMLMAASAEKYADRVVVTDDNPRTENPNKIIDDIVTGFTHPASIHIVQPREKAITYALNQLQAGDVLLIAGKGHENYQIIGQEKLYFSDQEIVQTWLKK